MGSHKKRPRGGWEKKTWRGKVRGAASKKWKGFDLCLFLLPLLPPPGARPRARGGGGWEEGGLGILTNENLKSESCNFGLSAGIKLIPT